MRIIKIKKILNKNMKQQIIFYKKKKQYIKNIKIL